MLRRIFAAGLVLSGCRLPNPHFDDFAEGAGTTSADETSQSARCADDCSSAPDFSNDDDENSTGSTERSDATATFESSTTAHETTSGSQSATTTSTFESSATSTTSATDPSSTATSDSTSTDSLGNGTTTEVDPELPSDGGSVPFPDPLCASDSDLLACFLFNDLDGKLHDPRGTLPDGYGAGITVVMHSSDMPPLLQRGWRLRSSSQISIDVGDAFLFDDRISIELWWGTNESTYPTNATLVEINNILELWTDGTSGIGCHERVTGDGTMVSWSTPSPVMYTRCVVEPNKILLDHLPGSGTNSSADAPLFDFSKIRPPLSIARPADGQLSAPVTLYGLRIWKKDVL